ncbi:uncharacterized protein [Montipora foliosa]|uniref:uncharacterized protein n=1 Tax=Montipora foliosa TaxID=591990 RepID=UPI0035F189F5
MDKVCFCFFVCVVLFGTEVDIVFGQKFYVQAHGRINVPPGSLFKLHDDKCHSSKTRMWCTASASEWRVNDKLASLTMRYHHGGSICFEIKHNQIQFSLKVLNHSEIVFEKLQPGKDCTSDSANLFHVSDYYSGGDVFVRLRSQKRGLKPAKRAYLAATVDTQPTPLVSGKLLLVEKHDSYQRNKLKIRLVY